MALERLSPEQKTILEAKAQEEAQKEGECIFCETETSNTGVYIPYHSDLPGLNATFYKICDVHYAVGYYCRSLMTHLAEVLIGEEKLCCPKHLMEKVSNDLNKSFESGALERPE